MPLSAIIDTNVLVAGFITNNPRSANAALLAALWAGRFTHVSSAESLAEVKRVLQMLGARGYHQSTADEIERLCVVLEFDSTMFQPTLTVSPAAPRDPTDAKWLALATQSDADYLVTAFGPVA